MNVSVLIMSCDGYSDLWQPFYELYKKYWNPPYKTYLCNETKDCEYFETIKTQGEWTTRLRKALEQIDSEYVLLMLDDFFIREYVDQERITRVLADFKTDTAVYNFEKVFDTKTQNEETEGFKQRINKDSYLNSCQPSIHNRKKLLERLQEDMNAWQWETKTVDSPYKFYINCEEWIIDVGHRRKREGFGITRGKWTEECIEFLKKEKVDIDFSIRGKFEGRL